MSLIPYDPLQLFRRDHWPAVWPRWADEPWFGPAFHEMPRVDVRENAEEVIVTADIPGLERKEDVHISVHDHHLHLSGKVEQAMEEHGENVHRTERFFGQFSRTVPLPSAVDETRAKATYRNGILEIRLPKQAQTRGRTIDVDFH